MQRHEIFGYGNRPSCGCCCSFKVQEGMNNFNHFRILYMIAAISDKNNNFGNTFCQITASKHATDPKNNKDMNRCRNEDWEGSKF